LNPQQYRENTRENPVRTGSSVAVCRRVPSDGPLGAIGQRSGAPAASSEQRIGDSFSAPEALRIELLN
jgi:hypothetical protein